MTKALNTSVKWQISLFITNSTNIQGQDVTVADQSHTVSDVETVCKLASTALLLLYTNSTFWSLLAASILLIKIPGSKAGLTETLQYTPQVPRHVLAEEWRYRNPEEENLQRVPSLNLLWEPWDFPKVLANVNGVGRADVDMQAAICLRTSTSPV